MTRIGLKFPRGGIGWLYVNLISDLIREIGNCQWLLVWGFHQPTVVTASQATQATMGLVKPWRGVLQRQRRAGAESAERIRRKFLVGVKHQSAAEGMERHVSEETLDYYYQKRCRWALPLRYKLSYCGIGFHSLCTGNLPSTTIAKRPDERYRGRIAPDEQGAKCYAVLLQSVYWR